jgi:hypothetical protein
VAVRTKRLAAGRKSTVATETIYTCPAGETAIIKRILLYNLNASTNNLISILLKLGAFTETTVWQQNFPASSGVDLDVWWVLGPGDTLGLVQSTAIGTNYLISGTELEGIAD